MHIKNPTNVEIKEKKKKNQTFFPLVFFTTTKTESTKGSTHVI